MIGARFGGAPFTRLAQRAAQAAQRHLRRDITGPERWRDATWLWPGFTGEER